MPSLPKKRRATSHGRSLSRSVLLLVAAGAGFLFFLTFLPDGDRPPRGDLFEDAFALIEKVRDAKKREVVAHFEEIHRLAKAIARDAVMTEAFGVMNRDGYRADERLEYLVDSHWVSQYGGFYDILFVGAEGTVFHSIRKESDYGTNLFSGPLAGTKLAKQMQRSPGEQFVDYEYYSPSEEPAAFFATPFVEEGVHRGWFVLQCPINGLETILTNRRDLGKTGEVYLVNEEKLMLTGSRFIEDSTTLKLRVDTRAVQEALKVGKGRRIVKDYRGVRVLSAFERFEVFGTTWMVICEIDEDEVITQHYLEHAGYYNERILADLAKRTRQATPRALPQRERVRVDLNEYAKAEVGQRLETFGVATCTAVAVTYPGRFAYLAHIGPTDSIYADGWLDSVFDGAGKSDFLGQLIAGIKRYDIYPYEMERLRFTIVAPHDISFGNVLKRLLESGVGLGRVKLIWNPERRYANVLVDPADNLVAVIWEGGELGASPVFVDGDDVEDLATIVRRLAPKSGS